MQAWRLAIGIGLAVVVLVPTAARAETITLEAEAAWQNPDRVEIVPQETFPSNLGASLKTGATTNVGSPQAEPDLVFQAAPSQAGRYWIRSHAAVDAKGAEAMRLAASKKASLRLLIAVGNGQPVSRVVFVPWSRPGTCRQTLGKFDFTGRAEEIRVWLPEGVRLDYLQLVPYVPPKVPPVAAAYQPEVVPPASRPRLWVNAESLPQVRANLEKPENAPLWARVQKLAARPLEFKVRPDETTGYNSALESGAVAKAFVHLMTSDRNQGREAVTVMRDYLAAVQFDNLLDITREIGRAIYSGALVYDWCYDVMTPAERDSIRANLIRLAEDMEIGWPPFRQTIVNGHGNEAQLNRDLLAMAIAVYDEDPLPYRYCAYRVLEELVPMRKFEYQSPRHNQGVSYGPYRFAWDLHAAWLLRRMSGRAVFDPNLGDVYKFWLYMRLPTGRMLRDGDGFSDGRPARFGLMPLLAYAYTGDPIIKGDFLRQNGMSGDPIPILLLNDPDLAPQPSLESLPLTIDFGPVLGSMVARTGWDFGPGADDVVVEMKGGGYHFGNHQHSDAGSFQIYYRGLQAVDLGQYHFYCSMAEDVPEGFDPLGYLVTVAHARGIDVHPWFVNGSYGAPVTTGLFVQHPEWRLQGGRGDRPWYDLGRPEVRDFQHDLMLECLQNYDVDGLHFDYIRYSGRGPCYCQHCQEEFARKYGFQPQRAGDGRFPVFAHVAPTRSISRPPLRCWPSSTTAHRLSRSTVSIRAKRR